MQFQCTCGQTFSTDKPPGSLVQCPGCGQTVRVGGFAPAPPPYGSPGYALPPSARTCGLATAALVLGLLGLLFSVLTAIPAVILGAVALAKIKGSRGQLSGGGMAVAGLVVGAILTTVPLLMIPIMLPALARARGAARAVQCSDNLRNINLAIFQYAVGSEDEMPPADRNICAALGVHMGDARNDDRGGNAWRCPSDDQIPEDRRDYWCSYAPNAGVEETDEVIGCFSSNAKLSSRLPNIAPDTISWVEMWTPRNVVEGHPGYELKLDTTKPESRNRSMVTPGKELVAIRSYKTARPVKFDASGRLTDCGNYLFLRAFIGKRIEEMYHNGRINVSYIDGHVTTTYIKDLIATDRPADNPLWTREAD